MRTSPFVLAYHGCDSALANRIILGKEPVSISDNAHDWLGTGAYFWDNDPLRALQWAERIQKHPQHNKHKIHHPAVIGAIIDPGNCLDLTDTESLRLVKQAYDAISVIWKLVEEYGGDGFPKNEKAHPDDDDLVKRYLDCAVINYLHKAREESAKNEITPFDSVRGIFMEGAALYPGTKIKERTHIQICVRNPRKSVIGYFYPLGNR
jgi:hypothetical protein